MKILEVQHVVKTYGSHQNQKKKKDTCRWNRFMEKGAAFRYFCGWKYDNFVRTFFWDVGFL